MTTTGRVRRAGQLPDLQPEHLDAAASRRPSSGGCSAPATASRSSTGPPRASTRRDRRGRSTSVAAAVAAGYPLNGTYQCPAALNIGGRSYANDGNPSLGADELLHRRWWSPATRSSTTSPTRSSCKDHPKRQRVTSPARAGAGDAEDGAGLGLRQAHGDRPARREPGQRADPELAVLPVEGQRARGQNWCKYGKANGTYVQQIEWDDCRSGNIWTAGQAVIASIGQGYVSVTPLQLARAYAALANGGTLYSPRIGEALVSPDGKVVRKITPAGRRSPAGRQVDAGLHQARAGRRGHERYRGRDVRRVPARPGVRGGQDRYRRRSAATQSTSVFASFAPCDHPKYVVVDDDPELRLRRAGRPGRRSGRSGTASTACEGHKAALPGGVLPGLPHLNAAGAARPPPAGFGPAAQRRAAAASRGRRKRRIGGGGTRELGQQPVAAARRSPAWAAVRRVAARSGRAGTRRCARPTGCCWPRCWR